MFHAKLAQQVARSRVFGRRPLVMMHAVTEACNARCSYCVFRHGKRGPRELSVDEIRTLYREAYGVGVRYVHLWGGEPLVHPELPAIAEAATRARLTTGIVTNDMLLERRAEEVVPWIRRIHISLDQPDERHDEMRSTRSLFRRAISGIERVRREWPDRFVLVAFTLCRDNADSVEDMARLCRRLGARLYINPMRSTANIQNTAGTGHNDEALAVHNGDRILSWEEQRPIWRRLLDLRRTGYPIQNSPGYMRKLARGGPPQYRCHWPKLSVCVDANGDVVDCQRWDQPIANVRDTPLAEVVRSARVRELSGRAGESCNACASPARVEPSGIWGLKPAMLVSTIRGLASRR